MMHYHAIFAKYVGPSDRKGSRIIYSSPRFHERLTVAHNYEYSSVHEQAPHDLAALGYTVAGSAESKDGYVYFVLEFIGLKEADRRQRDAAHKAWVG
jgi:hypothetical protein